MKMFSPEASATRPCGSSMMASSKPPLIASRLASTEFTYWPQILPFVIVELSAPRVNDEILARMPCFRPSSPRYAPHS